MAFQLKLTSLADQDLEGILDRTIQKWGEDQYLKYRGQLLDAFSSIVENPECLGSKSRDDLFIGARLYAVGRHYLLFYVSGDTIIVARILDQRMDLVRHLGDLGE